MTELASPTSNAYIPGVCNINTVEQAQRRKIGYIGTAIFIVLLIILLALPISRWVRVLLFLPAVLAASGFLQAKNHFCVGYAAAGKQNASEGSEEAIMVEDAQKAIDKKRASTMNRQSVAIGVVAAIIALAIPVFAH